MTVVSGRPKAVQYSCSEEHLDVVVPYVYFSKRREARKRLRIIKSAILKVGWCNLYHYRAALETHVSSRPPDIYWGWDMNHIDKFKIRKFDGLWYIDHPIPICRKESVYG